MQQLEYKENFDKLNQKQMKKIQSSTRSIFAKLKLKKKIFQNLRVYADRSHIFLIFNAYTKFDDRWVYL